MLSVDNLIQVSVSVSAAPVPGRTFNILMIAGDSNVISVAERFRTYGSIGDVANDFGLTAPEYLAASLYFQQKPQPSTLMIGRWLAAATSGFNLGGILTAAQQTLSNFTSITNGGLTVTIDGGSPDSLTGLNFSAVTNLNGVASIVSAALTGATCIWNGESFQIISNSTGAGAFASGTVTLTANPAPNDTLTVNGTVVTFVSSSPLGDQVVIGGTVAATLANLITFLGQSSDSNIDQATYAQGVGNVVDVTDKTSGTAGNSFTLTKSSSAITLSGATLSGGAQPSSVGYATPPGSGTDISGLLELTNGTNQALVSGAAVEQPADCAQALATINKAWYFLMFASTASISNAQNLAVAEFVEAASPTLYFGVTNTNANTLSSLVQNDISSLLLASGFGQSTSQFSSASPSNVAPYAIASYFGRFCSVNFGAQNTTIDVMWKQEPGITAENLTDAQAAVLRAKNCNVFAGYDNNSSIVQWGNSANGTPTDQVQGVNWFQNAVQTANFNLFYSSPTKIPQTTSGQNQQVSAIASVCGNLPGGAVWNGFAAPGVWNSSQEFGTLTTGQFLTLGYYIFPEPIDQQSEADRETREAPPVQVALKLAGAFRTANVMVTVNP